MKPAVALVAGLGLSIATGVVGFQLGRSSHNQTVPMASQESERASSRPRKAKPVLSKIQAQELVSLLDSQRDQLSRFAVALDNMEGWVAADPAGALAWLFAQPKTARRSEVMRLAIMQWAESDPAAAASWSRDHLQGVELQNALIRIGEQWAAIDPLSATRWFAEIPVGPARLGPLEGMFFRWAGLDPSTALSFLNSELPNDPNTSQILQAIHAGWAKSDPQAACASSLASSKETSNPDLFANTLANWATIDVVSSSEWLVQNVAPGPERSAAIQELAGMFAYHDPSSGLNWIENLVPDERANALATLAVAWAESDAESAVQWLASQPAPELNDDATSNILLGFLSQNEDAFVSWRDSLNDGPLKQKATELSQILTESN